LRPAFATRAEAIRFGLLMVAALAAPLLFARLCPGARIPLHGLTDHAGLFVLQEVVHADPRPDIDILLIGDSFLRLAVDAESVEQTLTRELGRPARVITFGFQHRGEELYYLALRDLLAHHKRPKLVVLDMPKSFLNFDRPHPWDWEIVSPAEDPSFFAGMRWTYRARLYGEHVLGMPRILFALLHDRRSGIAPNEHGSTLHSEGFFGAPFSSYSPTPPSLPAAQMIYSEAKRERWSFSNETLQPYPDHFDRKLVQLAMDNHIPLVVLSVPVHPWVHEQQVVELDNWPAYFGAPIDMVGIPPAQLFAGLSDADIEKLYWNGHFNTNGALYFTKAITPALVQLYRQVEAAPPLIKDSP
jgi:hypothetical protein